MKRFVSILLSSLLLVLSVPVIPAKSAPLYMTGDQALEIYLSILSLIETGRLASGYDNSIFSSNFADFQSNIAEINSYLASHSSELTGIDYYWTDGSSALKEDWVDEDWDLDGDGTADATGTLSNKLTVLTQDKIDELQDFNSGMNNNSFNENNNNPFDILKKVAIGAAVGAGTVFGVLSGFWASKSPENAPVNAANPNYMYLPHSSNYFELFMWVQYSDGTVIRTNNADRPNNLAYTGYGYLVDERRCFVYQNSSLSYYDFYMGFLDWRRYNANGTSAGYPEGTLNLTNNIGISANIPFFANRQDALNFFRDGIGEPLNLMKFNNLALSQGISNSVGLPLIDTQIRPYGFIGINGALSTALHNLDLSPDADDNADLWAITIPDIIDDVLPDYLPDNEPIPAPEPLPDPDPIPDPEPDPAPEPDPDPDIGDPIIDDEGDLTEIPIVSGLQGRFPFSIPWDIKHLIENLSAEREAPAFEYDFYISPRWLPPNGFVYHFDIDLSSFDYLASLFRRLFLLSFIIGLAVYSYAKFFGGGE